ncbi:MAG: FxLYD domain-containing protein, partial [Anaerolineae bacterium]
LTYHIYWDMGLGLGLYTYKTSVEGTRYSDLNLRPGTAYRYLIVAYDGSSESAACEVLVTTHARPELIAVAISGPTQAPPPSPSRRPTATAMPPASPSPALTSMASPSPTSTSSQQPTATPASTQTPWISPTPPRIVATPTPLPPDTVLLGLMSSHEYEDDLGFFTIVGEVRNDLQMNAGKVLVTATFYNANGDVIEEVSTSTMLDILLPGQRSPFALTLPKPVDLWEYSLRITARPTLEQPLSGLEVVQSRAYEDEVGFYHVTGEVENTGQRAADRVQVIVTLYDKWGKIVNAGFVYSEPRRVRPGEKAAFDCSFNYYPLVKEHAIQVERD